MDIHIKGSSDQRRTSVTDIENQDDSKTEKTRINVLSLGNVDIDEDTSHCEKIGKEILDHTEESLSSLLELEAFGVVVDKGHEILDELASLSEDSDDKKTIDCSGDLRVHWTSGHQIKSLAFDSSFLEDISDFDEGVNDDDTWEKNSVVDCADCDEIECDKEETFDQEICREPDVLIKDTKISGETTEDCTDWCLIKETDCCSGDLIEDLVVEMGVGGHSKGEDHDTSCEVHKDEENNKTQTN